MKHFLLTCFAAAATLSASAGVDDAPLQIKCATDDMKVTSVKNSKSTSGRRQAPGVTMSSVNGMKRINAPRLADKGRKLAIRKKAPKLTAPDGYAIYENFEEWDGTTATWTPEGWTVDMRKASDRSASWTPGMSDGMYLNTTDGMYFYAIDYSSDELDEWLVSPSVDVIEGYQLSFLAYISPVFLFNLDDAHVDWDEFDFIGEKEVSATLQIWVQPEGADWTMLHDFVDDYKDMSLIEMYQHETGQFESYTFDLAAYAGKKVKIAFRYTGINGNTMALDAIGVGYPRLDDTFYMSPFSTLYWGADHSTEMQYVSVGVAQFPVYSPITWTNETYNDNATYSWTYTDPETDEEATSDNQDMLSLTYLPKFSGAKPRPNNLYFPPTLTATAPMATPGSYTAPSRYFQPGGKFLASLDETTGIEGNLLPFIISDLGVTWTTVDDSELGDMSIPVFGHNSNTDAYWLNYSLNGETANDGDCNKLMGIANLMMPSEAPLVVNGVSLNAWGKISNDAVFTATIWALNDEMSPSPDTFTKIVEATLSGADVVKEYADGDLGYMFLPFKFAEPVILKATEEHPAYFIEISGFNSDKVEYFAPLQSKYDDMMCWGYIHSYIDMTSHGFEAPYESFKPMVYKENGEYVDLYSAFAIGLDAEYPWLSTDCKGIDLKEGKQDIALNSYYDNSRLTVIAPEGLSATITGRYDECKLTVAQTDFSKEFNDNITVKGPGVELTIPVTGKSGISAIAAEQGAAVVSLCDLNGRIIDADDAAPGVYVAKYTDGSVRKLLVK